MPSSIVVGTAVLICAFAVVKGVKVLDYLNVEDVSASHMRKVYFIDVIKSIAVSSALNATWYGLATSANPLYIMVAAIYFLVFTKCFEFAKKLAKEASRQGISDKEAHASTHHALLHIGSSLASRADVLARSLSTASSPAKVRTHGGTPLVPAAGAVVTASA